MAANMTSTCSTSSRSTISTSARWRIRASTSSTRATSWPTPRPRPTSIIDAIAGVVAHEYFHNWSGNRVTCRDWFQLSLKEGFTVFRDQSFSADQGSAAVKRIEDVRAAARRAVPGGCRSAGAPDPPRKPIWRSRTSTPRRSTTRAPRSSACWHTMLGPQKFRAGTDLYFDRHDGTAATCEDFVAAMEEAAGSTCRSSACGTRRPAPRASAPR
jgi:hypothetical protein